MDYISLGKVIKKRWYKQNELKDGVKMQIF